MAKLVLLTPARVTRKIPVRVNQGMGVDAILGKAKRKMLATVYERVTGSVLSEGEADDPPLTPPLPPRAAQLAGRMQAASPPPQDDCKVPSRRRKSLLSGRPQDIV